MQFDSDLLHPLIIFFSKNSDITSSEQYLYLIQQFLYTFLQ